MSLAKLNFNRFSKEFLENTIPMYAEFRQHDPVHKAADGSWLLTRYGDVAKALKKSDLVERDHEGSINRKPDGIFKEFAIFNLVGMNPPNHTIMRKSLARAFTAREIDKLTSMIEDVADEMIDTLPEGEPVEFVGAVAYMLPVKIIANLLGVPAADHDLFHRHSMNLIKGLEFSADETVQQAAADACQALYDYLEIMCKKRENDFKDDLLSILIKHEKEDGISRKQVIFAGIVLIVAGHETTTHLISNGLHALIHHPEELQKMIDDPSIIKNAVEEMLRYDPSLHLIPRLTKEDIDFEGTLVPKGSVLSVSLIAANRDPEVFPDPDKFDVSRKNAVKNLSFAAGIHICIGLGLARLEVNILFEKLLKKFQHFELAGEPVRRNGLIFCGFDELPIIVRKK